MKKIKQYLNHIFIDGLSGMALGLFSTLIIGTILQQIGKETMNLWYDGTKYVIPCDILTQMLQTIEQYAILCFNVTEEHKAEVKSLTTIKEVDSYDYTTGYPEKLSFVV